jgi:hypothetical protein
MAAGGTLKATPPIVIGSVGASGAIAALGQRGHNTWAIKATAATATRRTTAIGSTTSERPERRSRRRALRSAFPAMEVELIGYPWGSRIEPQYGTRSSGGGSPEIAAVFTNN